MSPKITSTPPHPRISRNALIAGSVVVFHVGALWALQTGLLRRAVEVIVPVELLSQLIEPPRPREAPPPPPPKLPEPVKKPVVRKSTPAPPPPPQPAAIADPTPSSNAVTGVVTPQPAPPPIAAPVAVAPAPPAPPPAPAPVPVPVPRVQLPSSDADYLQNPKPAYPAISKRLGEQGKVVYSVLIGTDGLPISARLVQSSGFARLDEAAYAAVMRWRYVAGKRNGVVEAMSFNVPINWVLE
jgi:protein TonB